jgi:gamma-glutamylputrescine oxidase
MKKFIDPQDQVFWYLDNTIAPALRSSVTTDVAIIGGGMAGLTAAHSFKKAGLSVVLLEKNYCGAGASGKSSGFITPDSELSLYDLKKLYGEAAAQQLWQFVTGGVDLIRSAITNYTISCQYAVQDTLVVANTQRAFENDIAQEYQERIRLGYTGNLYNQTDLAQIIGSELYKGGVSYGDTFGIQAFQYCNAMSRILQDEGVTLYEETPAIAIKDHMITTPYGQVYADKIIVCLDQFAPDIGVLQEQVYHAQTFLMVSQPLTSEEIKYIFPDKLYMVWDTDLIYQYYRISTDNRLMLGGASLFYTYASHEKHHNQYMANHLLKYFKTKFPKVNLNFEYMWPGLIGLSKDIMPLAGPDNNNSHIYYISAAAGLPWAAALGNYSCEYMLNNTRDLDSFFDPYRQMPVGSLVQKIIGKPLAFALSNGLRIKKWA